MTTIERIRRLLWAQGERAGNIAAVSVSAYDTAWVAALRDPSGAPQFPASLAWLRANQFPDGSWGAAGAYPHVYYYDRLLATLRAVLTLQSWAGADDQVQIARGLDYIRRHAGDLVHDPTETVGFELIFPVLLAAAHSQDLDLPYPAFGPVNAMRQAKLAQIPLELAYHRELPLATSLEALGTSFDPALAAGVQEANGSVGTSPSATSFLLTHWPDNPAALAYLAQLPTVDGGIPAFAPMETFTSAWMLYYLGRAWPELYTNLRSAVHPLLDFLWHTRTPTGWTASAESSVKEGDTTAVVCAVLGQAGYTVDPAILYQYEEQAQFRTYFHERNPSSTTNAHVLDALRYCPEHDRSPREAKILAFLAAHRQAGGYWYDKWHVSPYYATSQTILAAAHLAPALIAPAVAWITATQHADGGWGTVEETAYALMALAHVAQEGGHGPLRPALRRGRQYLEAHLPPEALTALPQLWVGKALYTVPPVVEAAVLAALIVTTED